MWQQSSTLAERTPEASPDMAASSTTRRGNGRGYGGPAKGKGSDAPSFGASLENRISGDEAADPAVREWAAIKAMTREQQAEIVTDVVLSIAINGERDNDRTTAALGFLDRVIGKPVQRNLNINTDATPQAGVDRPPPETREEWIARRRRELAGNALLGSPAGTAD